MIICILLSHIHRYERLCLSLNLAVEHFKTLLSKTATTFLFTAIVFNIYSDFRCILH